jgi:hypothetical protein
VGYTVELTRSSLDEMFPEWSDSPCVRPATSALVTSAQTCELLRSKCFSFIARQKRIQLDGEDFYIDLLLYNRKLKRLVAVELKQGSFRPEYKGQMELYLRWLAKYESEDAEGQPLGIILCAGASTRQIELLEFDAAGIHVAEYLTATSGCSGTQVAGRYQCCSPSIRAQTCNRYVLSTCVLLVDLLIDLGDLCLVIDTFDGLNTAGRAGTTVRNHRVLRNAIRSFFSCAVRFKPKG